MSDAARMAIVLGLVGLTGCFTLAEYALLTTRQWRMRELAEGGDTRAAAVLALTAEPLRFISTIQLGVSAVGILVGAVGQPVLRHMFHPPLPAGVSFATAVLAVTLLSVLVGDLLPKAIALQQAERLARGLAPTIARLEWLAFPLVWLLENAAAGLLRVFRLPPPGLGVSARSEQDLRGILGEAEASGVIEQAEEELLYNVFDFVDADAREIMVPWGDVATLSADLTADAALARVLDAPYTRHPVLDGDTVVGILDVRDLLTAVHRGTDVDTPITDLVRPALHVPPSKDVGALLSELRRDRQKLAIVLDAAGHATGIVTLEDLLEKIAGEIDDEFSLPDEAVHWVDDRTVRVAGTFPVDDFEEYFATLLPRTRFHTLAGFAFDRLGHVAVRGDELHLTGLKLRVVADDGPRDRIFEARFDESTVSPGDDEPRYQRPRTR